MNRVQLMLISVALVAALAAPAVADADVFTVTSTADVGPGSLRAAIQAANANPNPSSGADEIHFNLTGAPPYVIAVPSDGILPTITDPVTIDATTQPGFVDPPVVELRSTGRGDFGLDIRAGRSAVCGLAIDGFDAEIFLYGGGENRVEGNYIGLDTTGVNGLGHFDHGIEVIQSADNVIGVGAHQACKRGSKRNVIARARPSTDQIFVAGDGTRIAGNYIGTDATGTTGLGNATGIVIYGSDNTVGGTLPADRNVVADGLPGLGVYVGSGSRNLVAGNFIGTDVTGEHALPNGTGIYLGYDASDTTIGGTTGTTPGGACSGACNVVSGNEGFGIAVTTKPSAHTSIQGNFVGVDQTGTQALGNIDYGILLSSNSTKTAVGGVQPSARNIVSGNCCSAGGAGIGVFTPDNVIQGNYVGTDTTGLDAIPNQSGIRVDGDARNNLIGGLATGAANLIAFNFGQGVKLGRFSYTETFGNAVLGNSIHSNLQLGIDLCNCTEGLFTGWDGPTPNDELDADEGANHLQNFPELTADSSDGTTVTIAGRLSSTPNTSGYRLEFFANDACDPSGYGEGERFLGSTTVATGSDGNGSFNVTLAAAVAPDSVITATATDPAGNTSEFSGCGFVSTASPGTIVVKKVTAPAAPAATFRFSAGGALSPANFTLAGGESRTFSNVSPGSGYSIAESVPAGWELKSASCDDGSSVANIEVAAGETVTCTFLNAAVFAPGGGAFVIGDKNATVGADVTFWGAQWWKLNSLTGGTAPAAFKGFAKNPRTPSCGQRWDTGPGNSPPPPPGPLPNAMAVIVASSIAKSGATITGDTPHIVIVKTNAGYDSNPGHAGTGTVISEVC